jgi:hypothetical protein
MTSNRQPALQAQSSSSAQTLTLVRALLLALAVVVLLGACGKGVSDEEKARAVVGANAAYLKAKSDGVDLGNGPCIADPLPAMLDWSVDVAHKPRQPVDDRPENQCAGYRQGKTHHFVELDPDGQVIRVQ